MIDGLSPNLDSPHLPQEPRKDIASLPDKASLAELAKSGGIMGSASGVPSQFENAVTF